MDQKIEKENKKKYHENMHRAKDWFSQAENDLLWAQDTLKAGRFAQDQAEEALGFAERFIHLVGTKINALQG